VKKMTENLHPSDISTHRCPSCGKKNPEGSSCVHCGATFDTKKRTSVKKTHVLMVILSLIGMGMIAVASYEINKITPIGEITEEMDGEVVQITGLVLDMEYNREYEIISFTINDSSGSIEVFGWSDITTELRNHEWHPSLGDNITLEGRVDYTEDAYYGATLQLEMFNLQSLEHVHVNAQNKSIGEILWDDVGEKVMITGEVSYKNVVSSGGTIDYALYEITDQNSDTIPMYMKEDMFWNEDQDFSFPNETQTVRIIGIIEEFNGELEIIPSNITNSAIQITEAGA